MAHKKTQKKEENPVLEQLYDALMYDIEPELVTHMLSVLPEIYDRETPEEKQERAKRYAKAFETFSERFGEILDLWKSELVAFKEKALTSFKERSTKEDASHLSDIEHSIDEQ